MSRPTIICHMHTLLNGKIDGIANPTSVGMRSQKLYFDLFLGKDRYYRKHHRLLAAQLFRMSQPGRRWHRRKCHLAGELRAPLTRIH